MSRIDDLYAPNETQFRTSCYYVPRERYRFPRKVFAIFAIAVGVLLVGIVYAARF